MISKSVYANGSVDDAMEGFQQCSKPDEEIKKKCSFSDFYYKDKENMNVLSINELLRVPPVSVNSYAIARHCSKVIVAVTNKLNPGQQLVISTDQQFYVF